jgi:hypothetical protein
MVVMEHSKNLGNQLIQKVETISFIAKIMVYFASDGHWTGRIRYFVSKIESDLLGECKTLGSPLMGAR